MSLAIVRQRYFGTLSTFGITEQKINHPKHYKDFGTLSTFGITEQATRFVMIISYFGTLSTFGITELDVEKQNNPASKCHFIPAVFLKKMGQLSDRICLFRQFF